MPTPDYDDTLLLPTTTMSGVAQGTGLDPFHGIDIVQALSLAYLFQKTMNPHVYDGTTMNFASGTAPGTFTAGAITASGSGPGVTGNYLYTSVYFDPSHVEYCTTGPWADLTTVELFRSVTPSGQDVRMTVSDPPATEPRLIRARIFRSLASTADMRQLTGTGTYSDVTVVPGGASVRGFSDTGGVTDAELATRDPLNTRKRYFADGLPPKSHTACFFEGRMWIVDPANGNLCYSESNLPEDFPTDNFVTLLPSDEDPVPWTVALRVNNNQLMAYTERGCYLVSGSAPPFRVRALFRGVGSVSTQATLYADSAGVIFPAADAVYVHPGGSEVSRLGAPRQWPGMNPLDDLYAALDKGRLYGAVAILDRDRTLYSLAAPLANGDAVNTGGFEWDYVRSNWARYLNRVVTAFGYWSNVQGRLWPVFGDELGGVWQPEMGNSEGYWNATFNGVIDSATRSTLMLTVAGALGTTPESGSPLLTLDATTGAVLTRNRVKSGSSPTILLPLYPYPTAPATADVPQVGSIEGVWESGWWAATRSMVQCHVNYLYPYLTLQTGGSIRVLCGSNQNETLRAVANAMSVAQFLDKLAFNESQVVQLKVRFESTAPGTSWGLFGLDVEASVKAHRR